MNETACCSFNLATAKLEVPETSYVCDLQKEYDLGREEHVELLNEEAVKLAKNCARQWMEQHPGRPKFVAGLVGPTSMTLSVRPSDLSFDWVADVYYEQVTSLYKGGVDLFLVEAGDTLTCKAALCALDRLFKWKKLMLPIFISASLAGESGCTASRQTMEAFWTSISHAKPLAVGLSCAVGANTLPTLPPQLEPVCGLLRVLLCHSNSHHRCRPSTCPHHCHPPSKPHHRHRHHAHPSSHSRSYRSPQFHCYAHSHHQPHHCHCCRHHTAA